MGTRNLIIATGLAVCSLAACTREQLTPEPEECCTITAISESDATKTDFSSDFTLNWTEGDKIGVFNGGLPNRPLTLTSGAGTASATFSLDEAYSFMEGDLYAYYPYSAELELAEDRTISVDLNSQSYEYDAETKALKNSGKYFYMTGKSTVDNGETDVDVFFKNPLAAFVFSLTNNGETAAGIESVTVMAEDEVFGTAGKLNFADPDASEATAHASSVTATLTNAVLEPGTMLNIPLVLFPNDFSGKNLTFTVSYMDGDDKAEISKTITGRSLSRNTLAGIRIDLGESNVLEELKDVLANGGEFTLPCNVSGNFTVSATEHVIINLNGFTIANDQEDGDSDTFTVNPGSTLTISGEGTVDNTSHGKAAIYNNGTVTLKGGTYTRSAENSSYTDSKEPDFNSYYVILNHGDMTINEGVNIVSSGTYSSLINTGYRDYLDKEDERSGYIEGKGQEFPLLTINGGTFEGGVITIKNDLNGTLEINGGNFTNSTVGNIQNAYTTTINGGNFKNTAGTNHIASVYVGGLDAPYSKGETTINGGTFEGGTIIAEGTEAEKASMIVNGGSFYCNFSNSSGKSGYESGVVSINNGSFTIGDWAVLQSIAGFLTEDASITAKARNGFMYNICKEPIIFNAQKVDLNLNGQTLKYTGSSAAAITVSKGSVTIGNGSLKAASLVSDPSLSAIKVADGASLTLNDMSVTSSSIGINADEGATLTLNNTTITDELTISEDTELDDELKVFSTDMTINLNNKTLTLPRIVFMGDNASYTITGGTLEIEGAGSGLAIEGQNSELTLDGVTINAGGLDNGESAITCGNNDKPNSSGNILTVKNSTIKSVQTGINLRRGQTLVVENSTITHEWFGITQNGVYPGSSVTVNGNTQISGFATGIYLSNNAEGEKNILTVENSTISSEVGSPVEVKKTDLTIRGTTLKSNADPTYDLYGGGAGGSGYGIVLAGYVSGTAYEGDRDENALINGNTFELKAGDGYELFVYNGSNDHVPAPAN